ncbi:DDE-1 domain-containing protein [Trichonephila clavipes]|uniref:DDE-1 domain-containing protein n=1 Tax=Trichonephila clavipes TaxID=2585209 RepID=A0A8X6VHJ0_TRICX|nr:DDE-1 domain-containing protein [Trichonephila clavipes]
MRKTPAAQARFKWGCLRNFFVLLNYAILPSEESVAVDNDNMYTAPIKANKDILEFVQSSKNIIDTIDTDGEKEINNAAPVPTSSEMRNIMKSMRIYLGAHSNGEMNNKMGGIEQFVDNLMLKRQLKKTSDYFPYLSKCFAFQKT